MMSNYIDENLQAIRGEFKLTDYWVYLNAGDQMIPGNYWLKAVREFYNFVEFGRMEDIPNADIATHPFLTTAWKESTERGARFINADPEEVTNAYRPSITANLIMYNMMDWKAGDNIVFNDLSYPSFLYIASDISKRYGVEIRMVRHVDGEILMEDLEAQIDDNTKLVVVDRTTAFCGFTFDVKEVCKIAHKHGALVLDDAIQAVGAINIDVKDDDVDMLVTGAYKWQCGPEGAGLFYIKKELMEKIDPRFRNYIWADIPGPVPFAASGCHHRAVAVRLDRHIEVLRKNWHPQCRRTGQAPGNLCHRSATGNWLHHHLANRPCKTPRTDHLYQWQL
jgi:selenocysteine lyase/cysteine desulfurase